MQRTQSITTTRRIAAPIIALSGVVAICAISPTNVVLAYDGEGSEDAPETIELIGIVRDFREQSHEDGHPDMEQRPAGGFGLYQGNVALLLGEDGNPVFTGNGKKVSTQAKDSSGRKIAAHMQNKRWDADSGALVDHDYGDWDPAYGVNSQGGIQSAESFAQWFEDYPGVNMSMPLSLTFVRQEDGSYVFDDRLDEQFASLGGFFPLEDKLFGNPGGSPDRNFHFTFELHTEFTYHADGDQIFRFIGDDDVWVFIDGKLAIDLGGVHGATTQEIDLSRMGLSDGETYDLAFFFAERHRTQSNFRIETNLVLESIELPTISASFD